MEAKKLDPLQGVTQNIVIATGGESIVDRFEIVALDTNIMDLMTATLYTTQSYLIVSYDEVLEIYRLDSISLEFIGYTPKFTIWQQLLEGNPGYSEKTRANIIALKADEQLSRMVISEDGQIPKDYLFRQGIEIKKVFQTWAMYQILQNHKLNRQNDPLLIDMVQGSFTKFNQKTVLTFIVTLILYIIIRLIVDSFDVGILLTVLDVLFGIALVGMGIWTIFSINKNLQHFKRVYNSFQLVN